MGGSDSKIRSETGLSKDEVDKLRSKFRAMCTDGLPVKEGKLDKKTFLSRFPSVQQEQAEDIFRVFDTRKDGYINFSEFAMAMGVLMRGSFNDKLEFAFQLFDVNNTGEISFSDFKDIITTFKGAYKKLLGEADASSAAGESAERQVDASCEKLFHEADIQGNNTISLDEFKAFGMRHPELFNALDVILSAVKHASYWDWVTPGTS